MKLRNRTLVAAVPLFLLLGIVGNAIAWLVKAGEVRLAAERAAVSVAVALAEQASAHEAVATETGRAAMQRGAERLARWDLIEQIRLFDEAGDEVWRWRAPDAPDLVDAPLVLPAGVRQRGERLVHVRAKHPVVRAVAATSGGRVEVAWRLPGLNEEIARMRGRFLIEASLAVAVGVGLLWALGQMLTRDVRRLAGVMSQVGGGTYRGPAHLRVAELDDLSRTLGVLDAITHEARQKFERTQASLGTFRTDEDLGKAFRRSWLTPIDATLAGRRVAMRLLSDQAVGHAFGVAERFAGNGEQGAAGLAWMLRRRETPGLETAREASAAGAELAAALRDDAKDIAAVMKRVAGWFELEAVVVATWSAEVGAPVGVYRWTPGEGARFETVAEERVFCSDMSGAAVEAGATLVKTAEAEALETILMALTHLLGGTGGAVALIEPVGRETPDGPAVGS